MTRGAGRVLIADDQRDVLEALRLLLKGEGLDCETASSPAGVIAALEARDYDAALIDLNYTRDTTSGQEGLDLLARLRELDANLPVIVMTAWGTVDLAVEAMRRGARDFVQKPWDNTRLLTTLRTQIALGRALKVGQRLEAENRLLRQETESAIIATSPAMTPVLEVIARVGPSDANVLIQGENGSGKGVVARALHAASPRSGKPFVTLNAGGISEGVFESELFGHVRGRLHGRPRGSRRPVRAGRRRDAVSRRDWQRAHRPAGQAAARARDRRVRARRVLADDPRRRAHPLGHQRRPSRGRRRRPLPPGPPLSPEHDRDPRAEARAAARGHSAPGPLLPHGARPPVSQERHRLRRRGPRGVDGAPVAGQRPRARSCRRARGPDGDPTTGSASRILACAAARKRHGSRTCRWRKWRACSCTRPWTASAET